MTVSLNQIVEEEVLSELKLKFPNFDVQSYPANFENYHFTSSMGSLLVKFVQTDYLQQNTVWNVNQEIVLKFEIVACYRGMDNYAQIHTPQQQIKDTLQGMEIMGRKIFLEKEQFINEKNTDIFCRLVFKIKFWQDEKTSENEEL